MCLREGRQGGGREEEDKGMGVLTSKWEGKNRVFSLEKLRFSDLIICVVRVVIKGFR